MEANASLYYAQGFVEMLYAWRFLAILFGAELLALFYVVKKERGFPLLILTLIIIELAHEALYHHNLVPVMNWFIPTDDPVVARVLHYQTKAYWALAILTAVWYGVWGRKTRLILGIKKGVGGWGGTGDGLLPLSIIICFALLQQLVPILTGFYLFQESDTPRVLEYARHLVRGGFKEFVDLWMLPGNYYQMIELDMPVVSIVWSGVYALLSQFASSAKATDAAHHIVSLGFWTLSLWGTFLLGRELFGKRVGAFAAMFLALTPYYSFMGYLLMTDVPMTAITTLATYCFVRAVREEGTRYGLLSGVLLFIGVLTKILALYYLGVFILFQLLFFTRRQWKPLVSCGAAFAAGMVVVMIVLASLYGGELLGLVAEFIERKLRIVTMESNRMRQGYVSLFYRGQVTFFFYFQNITAYLGFGIITLALVSLFVKLKDRVRDAREKIFLVLWPLGFMLYFSFQLTKSSRWIFSAYPAIAVLAAYGFVKLEEKPETRKLAYALLVFIMVEMIGRHISYYESIVSKVWILREYAYF